MSGGGRIDIRLAMVGAALLWGSVAPAHAEVIKVTVGKLDYAPAQVTAHVGDTIEWTNTDFVAHTATARTKAWDVMILPNKTGKLVLTKAGEIDYYCRFHPTMAGHISVTEK